MNRYVNTNISETFQTQIWCLQKIDDIFLPEINQITALYIEKNVTLQHLYKLNETRENF